MRVVEGGERGGERKRSGREREYTYLSNGRVVVQSHRLLAEVVLVDEGACIKLIVPSFNPVVWADGEVSLEELLAWRVPFTLDLDALVEIHEVLPAVPGLVAHRVPAIIMIFSGK
jgi:hypothetical protein